MSGSIYDAATKATDKAARPPKVILIPPTVFQDTWEKRPIAEVAVGLRRVPSLDIESARAEAASYAWEMHNRPEDLENRHAAMTDCLMRWIVAKVTTDPNDVHTSYFDMAVDTVPIALRPEGIRRIFDEYERFAIETSPVDRAADNTELAELATLLEAGVIEKLTSAQELRARKLLGFILEELRALLPQTAPTPLEAACV